MPKIAISYRRSDASAMAGRILDCLADRYGRESIFIDIEDIPLGTDFRVRVQDALRHSRVLLALISPQWLGSKQAGPTRIREPDDPVRVEIETALRKRIPLIPVLVDGASMPAADDLPASLTDITYRNAAKVDSGLDFHVHMDRLMRSIDLILSEDLGLAASAQRPGDGKLHPDASRPESAAAAVSSPSSNRWLAYLLRYVLLPITLLVVAHHIIVNALDLNTIYLRIVAMIIPFAFGLLFFWQTRLRAGLAAIFATIVSFGATVAMAVSAGLNANQPILPSTIFEWREDIEYIVSIALSFVAGYMLARGLLLLRWQKVGKF
jgi:hypothetical protein